MRLALEWAEAGLPFREAVFSQMPRVGGPRTSPAKNTPVLEVILQRTPWHIHDHACVVITSLERAGPVGELLPQSQPLSVAWASRGPSHKTQAVEGFLTFIWIPGPFGNFMKARDPLAGDCTFDMLLWWVFRVPEDGVLWGRMPVVLKERLSLWGRSQENLGMGGHLEIWGDIWRKKEGKMKR